MLLECVTVDSVRSETGSLFRAGEEALCLVPDKKQNPMTPYDVKYDG